MYGGDEVGAVVLDMGSVAVKAGFAGEGAPKLVIPSVACARPADPPASGKAEADGGSSAEAAAAGGPSPAPAPRHHVGHAALYRRDGVDVTYPVQNGLVSDWDAAEELWRHALVERLRVAPEEHPAMLAEAAFNTIENRERAVELAFEKFQHPAAYFGRAPVLAAFSVGKSTATVLDCGGGHTSAVPVHDGFVLNRAVHKTKVGGQLMDEVVDAMLFELNPATNKIVPRPLYQLRRAVSADGSVTARQLDLPGTTASFHRHARLDLVRDIKETVCRVAEEPFDVELNRNIPPIAYELPDGNKVELGTDRFMAGEKLFVPGDFELLDDLDKARGYRFAGVSRLVSDCIEACDADLRRELYANVVVVGGMSLLPGFQERLARDLNETCPPALKAKLQVAGSPVERQHGVWIGGSVLASLGSFHQLWMSKAEYEENGISVMARKCP